MTAYLIVDIDDLLERLRSRGVAIDLHELATRLRSGAALAAGLPTPDALKAIAVADWTALRLTPNGPTLERTFEGVGFETFNLPGRQHIADALIIQYFSFDPEPIDELIIVTSSADVTTLIRRVRLQRNARIRIWSDTPQKIEGVIVQPLDAILGLQAKTAALYVDFENIAISLAEQGYAVDLDALIEGLKRQAAAHGQVTHMAAYAPWGQRSSLPPLVDGQGRELGPEALNRLLMSNIEPRVTLPGKNSADMRIAQDVLADSIQPSASDIYIIASGDRDFNDMFSALRARGKQVVVWGVHGTISRMLQQNSALHVEYLDDFLALPHRTAQTTQTALNGPFTPSQWSSLVLQYDLQAARTPGDGLSAETLQDQLRRAGVVASDERGRDLIQQAVLMGVIRLSAELIYMVADNPIVERTRLIRDRIVSRVANTLEVRNWEYVNYGFLLKGLAMDRSLDRPGFNLDDAWRSDWIEDLVREGLLVRELVPHRHNSSDLVPVIKLPGTMGTLSVRMSTAGMSLLLDDELGGYGINGTPDGYSYELESLEPANFPMSEAIDTTTEAEIEAMMRRVIVSIDQFTSYRRFTWCPLGSLHKRLRPHDSGMGFQRAVERLLEQSAVQIDEYENPLSPYRTKGISLVTESAFVQQILNERNQFIRILINLYDQRQPISVETLVYYTGLEREALALWVSMMELENVLNPVPNRPDQYTLFRGHHTVNLIAGTPGDDIG